MVIVSVPLALCAIDSVEAEGASLKLPMGFDAITVRLIGVDAVSVPLVPVIVTVLVPGVAVADAEKVTTELEPVVEPGLKLAVTPLGRPLAEKATAPLKPPVGLIAIVLLPLAP
jgi:hypothetical protein